MSKTLEELALRKQLLQARSSYYRLKLRHEIHTMGSEFHWVKLGAAAISMLPIRSALFGYIFKSLRESRRGRLITSVIRLAAFAKMASSVVHLFRRLSSR